MLQKLAILPGSNAPVKYRYGSFKICAKPVQVGGKSISFLR